MAAGAVEALGLEGGVRVHQRVRGFCGRSIVGSGERVDCLTVEDPQHPVEFVALGVVAGVAGVDQEVDRPAGGVDAVRGSDHAVEELRGVGFVGPPGAAGEDLGTGEAGGRLLVHDVRIADVDEAGEEGQPGSINRFIVAGVEK